MRSAEPEPSAESGPTEQEPAETAANAPPPSETVPSASPPSETVAPETRQGEPPPEVAGRRPGETAVTAHLPDVDLTQPGRTAPGRTRLGQAGKGAPTVETGAIAAGAASAGAGVAEQRRPPETRRARPARPAAPGPVVAAAALLLLAVVVLGFVIGRSGGGSEGEATPAAENSNAAGALELSFPDGWQRSTSPPDIPASSSGTRSRSSKLEAPLRTRSRRGSRTPPGPPSFPTNSSVAWAARSLRETTP